MVLKVVKGLMGELVAHFVLTQTGLGKDKERARVEVQSWESRVADVLQVHHGGGDEV